MQDGEQPSAGKINAIASQARNGQNVIEMLVGDPWNQAGDYVLSPDSNINLNALKIPNLSRYAGMSWLLNSHYPNNYQLGAFTYKDYIGTGYEGLTRARLSLRYTGLPTAPTLSGTFAPLVQGNFKTDPVDVDSTGDWSVDSEGNFYSFDPIPSTLILLYDAELPSDTDLFSENAQGGTGTPRKGGLWNLLPGKVPGVSLPAYDGVKISFANGVDHTNGFHIWLPPRLYHSFPDIPYASLNVATGAPDSASPDRLFQAHTENAALTRGDHYRYLFPDEIAPGVGYTNLAAGTQLPSNFIYIWDEDRGTIIEGCSFFTPANTTHARFKVRVTGSELVATFGNAIGSIITSDATQLPADYKSRFKVIVVGNPISSVVSFTRDLLLSHTHKLSEGTAQISHSDLSNLVTPPEDATINPNYPSDSPVWLESAWAGDDHPQYFHRRGAPGLGSEQRDGFDNAIYKRFLVNDQLTAAAVPTASIAFTTQSSASSILGNNTAVTYFGGGLSPTTHSWYWASRSIFKSYY
jgi:hypothetical protein